MCVFGIVRGGLGLLRIRLVVFFIFSLAFVVLVSRDWCFFSFFFIIVSRREFRFFWEFCYYLIIIK